MLYHLSYRKAVVSEQIYYSAPKLHQAVSSLQSAFDVQQRPKPDFECDQN